MMYSSLKSLYRESKKLVNKRHVKVVHLWFTCAEYIVTSEYIGESVQTI